MAGAPTPTTHTTSSNRALLKGLGAKLHASVSRLRNHHPYGTASSFSLLALAVLPCGTALARVVVFFLPLVISTSICCAAVFLLVSSEASGGGAAKEVVILCGDRAEVGLLEVYGDANASAYGDRRDVQVGCFLRRHRHPGVGGGWTKSGVDEEGDEVVFAGRVAVGGGVQVGAAALEEELVALQVDRLAEGVWDSYFGGPSSWNCLTDGSQEIEVSSST